MHGAAGLPSRLGRGVALGRGGSDAQQRLNGASVDGAPTFTYYDPDLLRIAVMHPRGGRRRAAPCSISLADDALLVDLGGEAHAPLCFDGTALRRVVVDAAGLGERACECSGVEHGVVAGRGLAVGARRAVERRREREHRRLCGAARVRRRPPRLRCVAPEYGGGAFRDGMATLALSVSIDGQSFSGGQLHRVRCGFLAAARFAPRGGPSRGTSVAFALSPVVADLGDVRCRFGEYKGTSLADAR